jgi:prepilin-type N-terminal cleavage/methylation domain-containing protein
MNHHSHSRAGRGFSLIELLVVMGLLVSLAAAHGFARRGSDNDGMALRSAQAEIASLLGTARSLAVLQQASVRVIVHAAQPPGGEREKYLRCLQLAVEQPAGSGKWVSRDEPVFLSRGVMVVPPAVAGALVESGIVWPAGPFAPVSAMPGGPDLMLNGREIGEAYWVEYTPDGRAEPADGKLAVATAHVTGNTLPRFDNPAAVRGLRLYRSGAVGWINHADDF